ncbi:MAG: hypothetical protein FE046_02945 [Thermoplasmata archaeon]|nr:MAG: hypothetical protein FE046_02945 [Thermoplasmata archaeon]RLF33918.1 MAG: hypothetical protein DRN07_01270 [Thermoplasmata archaeon]
MKMGAKISIVCVAIALIITPFLANAGYEGKKVSVNTTVITPLGKETKTIEVSESDAEFIGKKALELQDALVVVTNPDADEDERSKAMEIVEEFIYKLQEMGLVPATFPVASILSTFMSPKLAFLLPILSFGHGISWIPMYPGEAFIGFMFRPIFMQYFGPFGYSGTLNVNLIPPRIEYWDMVGTHTLFVLGFVGVYIDLGQIGFGIPDLQFLFGEAAIAGGMDWF